MAVLVDTDVLVDVERSGDSSRWPALREPVAISVVTMSELLQGVARGDESRRAGRRAFVEGLFEVFDAIPVTAPVARIRADLWADLAARGEAIGSNDLWIAATAITHGFGLATRNSAEFGRVSGLRLVAV